jgi:hypothetical protein
MKRHTSILITLILLSVGPLSTYAQAAKKVNVIVTPYVLSTDGCERIGTDAVCYFDVPAGTIFQIEHVSGFTSMGSLIFVVLQYISLPATVPFTQWLIPATVKEGPSVIFSASVQGYATDSDSFTDDSGATHDLRVGIHTDGATSTLQPGIVTIVGRLIPVPAP